MGDRWVVLDVGEVLVDETRVWSTWASVLGTTPLTLMAVLGAEIAAGRSYHAALARFDPGWEAHLERFDRTYGPFAAADLYPDALPTLAALADRGLKVAVIANQPARRHDELVALGVRPAVMAMSDALGVAKPDPAFFARVLELTGTADRPGDVTYVGDRVDNDVLPAVAAGLRAVRIRRGPWGWLQTGDDPAHARIDTLAELLAVLPSG